MLTERESMNWITSHYDSVIPEESSSVVDNWSSSASSSHPSQLERPFHLSFNIKTAHFTQSQDITNIYSIL